MLRGHACRFLAVASIFCALGPLTTACSDTKPSSVSGSYTVRVLAGGEAKAEQSKLAAANKANFPGGSYVVVTISWDGQWSGSCEIYAAMSHNGEGWRLSNFTPSGKIGPGADASVARAFVKYPDVFAGIPAPPSGAANTANEDTFDLGGKKGTATIIYAIDPAIKTRISTDMAVAAEVECHGNPKAAERFSSR